MKHMFPFDSPTESVLALLVPIILGLYVAFLVKLKPSKEDEMRGDKLPTRTSKVMIETQAVKKSTESIDVKEVLKAESAQASRIQVNSNVPERLTSIRKDLPATSVVVDTSRAPNVKDAANKRRSLLDDNFEGCRHHMGHLSKLPKNTPIPNECFGCPETLECIRHTNSKKR